MKIKNFIIVGCLLAMASCSTEIEVDAPDFQVSTTSNTFQVGEEVTFSFTGDADMISFYSGELYRNYENRDGRVVNIGNSDVLLEFSTDVSGGTQEDQLSLLASTDFNGNYDDLQSVKSATWVDITDRFKIIDSTGFVSSTAQDISDLVQNGGPIYFAFKYETRPQVENGFARNWMIQNFNLSYATTIDGQEVNVNIIDQINSGFRIVDSEPENAPSRSVITNTRVSLLGNIYRDPNDPIYDPNNPIFDPNNPIYDPTALEYDPLAVRPEYVPYNPDSPYNDPHTETWAVSGPVDLNETDLGPDRPRVIKAIRNTRMDDYTYTYNTPGQYTAYFVARNTSIDDVKEVVRSVNLTITP